MNQLKKSTKEIIEEVRLIMTDRRVLEDIKNNPGPDGIYNFDTEMKNKWNNLPVSLRSNLLEYDKLLEKGDLTDKEFSRFFDFAQVMKIYGLHTGHIPDHLITVPKKVEMPTTSV